MDDPLRQIRLDALTPSLRAEATSAEATPFTTWLRGGDVRPLQVLSYASTFNRDDGYTVVRAMAAASLMETALCAKPIDYVEHEPTWRCFTLQHIPADIALEKGVISTPDRPLIRRVPEINDYSIISLVRTDALDVEGQRITLQRATESSDPVKTALAWFALDIALADKAGGDENALRWAQRWAQRFEDDTDAPYLAFRTALSHARRGGVLQALEAIRNSPLALAHFTVKDAAWTVAWEEAARARAHDVCADLAIERARDLDPGSQVHMRWVLLYALHQERLLDTRTEENPVARELIDLFYNQDVDFTATLLAVSIASRSAHLEGILREALPMMRSPITPILREAFSWIDRPGTPSALMTVDPAGALVAMRLLHAPEVLKAIPHIAEPRSPLPVRATPAPTPVLDDYETNADLLREPTIYEQSVSSPPARASQHSAPMRRLTTSDLSPFEHEQTQTHTGDRAALRAPDDTPHAKDGFHSGPPPQSDAPSDFDVLLVTSLPEGKRERADLVLASRLTHPNTQLQSLLPIIDEHAAVLPATVSAVAELLRTANDPRRAALFFEHAARAESRRDERAQRYFELGEIWRRDLQNTERALEYYIVSFTCDATNRAALHALRDIYLQRGQLQDLLGLYRVALQTLRQLGYTQQERELKDELQALQERFETPNARAKQHEQNAQHGGAVQHRRTSDPSTDREP